VDVSHLEPDDVWSISPQHLPHQGGKLVQGTLFVQHGAHAKALPNRASARRRNSALLIAGDGLGPTARRRPHRTFVGRTVWLTSGHGPELIRSNVRVGTLGKLAGEFHAIGPSHGLIGTRSGALRANVLTVALIKFRC